MQETQETRVRQSLGREDLLEEDMATHSGILAWRIPRAEEPGGLQSTGLQSWTGLKRGLVAKSCLTLVTLWTIAHKAPLSMGFPRQEYWSRLPFPPPRDLPDPGMEPVSLASLVLAGVFFTTEPPGKPLQP